MERLRNIKDRFKYGDVPTSWDSMKGAVAEGAESGIGEEHFPSHFYVSSAMLKIFHEMLPAKNGEVDTSKMTPAVEKALREHEVSRALVLDPITKGIRVQSKDNGESYRTWRGAHVTRKTVAGEIGNLHTHPWDSMPSSVDVESLMMGYDTLKFVITPARVVAMFRSNKTSHFESYDEVQGYLRQMGEARQRIDLDLEHFIDHFTRPKGPEEGPRGVWELDWDDLALLRIPGYEAKRGKNVFTRRDSIFDWDYLNKVIKHG